MIQKLRVAGVNVGMSKIPLFARSLNPAKIAKLTFRKSFGSFQSE